MNTYLCYYRGKKWEVQAATSLEAQEKAAAHFKVKKAWEVAVVLAAKSGEPVVHQTSAL